MSVELKPFLYTNRHVSGVRLSWNLLSVQYVIQHLVKMIRIMEVCAPITPMWRKEKVMIDRDFF